MYGSSFYGGITHTCIQHLYHNALDIDCTIIVHILFFADEILYNSGAIHASSNIFTSNPATGGSVQTTHQLYAICHTRCSSMYQFHCVYHTWCSSRYQFHCVYHTRWSCMYQFYSIDHTQCSSRYQFHCVYHTRWWSRYQFHCEHTWCSSRY